MNTKNVTEDDIAAFLLSTPDFFERNADLLTSVQLTSPHGNRAVSLQERQLELMREKIKGLELRLANMMRLGSENDNTHQKLLLWVIFLLQEKQVQHIPNLIVHGLQRRFDVPHITLRVWNPMDDSFASSMYAQPVASSVRSFVDSMNGEPYCGRNPDLEAVQWLESNEPIRSVALLPLYDQFPQQSFGLLVLGSAEERRFSPDMGVDILKNMATIASAALKRCLK